MTDVEALLQEIGELTSIQRHLLWRADRSLLVQRLSKRSGQNCADSDARKKAIQEIQTAAEKNDPEALFLTGLCRLWGYGLERDAKLARALFAEACKRNHPDAFSVLGTCYAEGEGGERDERKAYKLFLQSSKLGSHLGQCNEAWCATEGMGVEASPETGANLYRAAARAGNPLALCEVGMGYESGFWGEVDHSRALKLVAEAARQNYGPALTNYASLIQDGAGGPYDPQKALDALERAANLPHFPAYTKLALLYLSEYAPKNDPNNPNHHKAVEWLVRGASLEDPDSLAMLGDALIDGDFGVFKNQESGVSYLKLAAKGGSGAAAFRFAQMIEKGEITDLAPQEAARYYAIAAADGKAEAFFELARIFLEEKILPKNREQWYEMTLRAAWLGEPLACMIIGRMLQHTGEPSACAQAFEVFERGFNNGSSACAFALADCFERGLGTERDLDAAKTLRKIAKEFRRAEKGGGFFSRLARFFKRG